MMSIKLKSHFMLRKGVFASWVGTGTDQSIIGSSDQLPLMLYSEFQIPLSLFVLNKRYL